MLETSKILLFLILLSVGKTPTDLKEFARIKGQWEVVGVESGGKKVASDKWGLKTFVIDVAEGAKEQPLNSIIQWGRLNTRHSPYLIESRLMTVRQESPTEKEEDDDPLAPRFPEVLIVQPIGKSCTLYEAKGDKLRLLITPIYNKFDKPPTQFVTTSESKGILYELKRKIRKAASSKNSKE